MIRFRRKRVGWVVFNPLLTQCRMQKLIPNNKANPAKSKLLIKIVDPSRIIRSLKEEIYLITSRLPLRKRKKTKAIESPINIPKKNVRCPMRWMDSLGLISGLVTTLIYTATGIISKNSRYLVFDPGNQFSIRESRIEEFVPRDTKH